MIYPGLSKYQLTEQTESRQILDVLFERGQPRLSDGHFRYWESDMNWTVLSDLLPRRSDLNNQASRDGISKDVVVIVFVPRRYPSGHMIDNNQSVFSTLLYWSASAFSSERRLALVGYEWLIVIAILLVVFLWGPKRLPELARSLGLAKKEFRKAVAESSSTGKEGTDEPPSVREQERS